MEKEKYTVHQFPIQSILGWVKSGEIAIPEIQRPFVWDSTKVRDLIDSLYQGYPIGYLISWKAPNVKLKDGKSSEGKKILIDGQQRVTALTAAISGQQVMTKEYKKVKIQIAFHPPTEKFEVMNPAIQKDVSWFHDIGPIVSGELGIFQAVGSYCEKNPSANRDEIGQKIDRLRSITNRHLGLIELASDLDIETVTEVFIRINSEGVVLGQADFAMSKIASSEQYNGPVLRKCIEYFCHMSVAPEYYSVIKEGDTEFAKTTYFQKMSWLKDEKEDLYDPKYTDLLRVAFTSEFNRGRLSDLVNLLSGRNFETRSYEEEIAKKSFEQLERGILNFINDTNFKRFLMIIKSAGFISSSLIRSQNALNFAYIAYLKLRAVNFNPGEIESFVRRWFVMSILTGRYSGSAESEFDKDIRLLASRDPKEILSSIEEGELSDAFWNASLVQSLDTSVASSPFFNVFLACQIKSSDKGFLSKDISIGDLISHRGDIHHLFPKDLLTKAGYKRGDYNQIANYALTQQEINIKIGKKSPKEYMGIVLEQMKTEKLKLGSIKDQATLTENMTSNCVPKDFFEMEVGDYKDFLKVRRRLMAEKIKKYYFSL